MSSRPIRILDVTIQDDLSKLGLSQPTVIAPIASSQADEITAIVREVCAADFSKKIDIGRPHELDDAIEIYQALEMGMVRLAHKLSHHGVKIAEVLYKHKFSRPCQHPRIEIDEALASVRCLACGAGVNPVWWMHRHTEEIQRSEDWRLHLEADKRKLAVEIDGLKCERSKHKQAVKRAKEPPKPRPAKVDIAPKRRGKAP